MISTTDYLPLFIEHTPAAVAMFDREMRYLLVSKRWLTDYGLGEQNIIGRSHYEVFPEIPPHWKDLHQRCLAGAVEQIQPTPLHRADGKVEWMRGELCPWRDDNGEIGGIIMFNEVITAVKEAEVRLRAREARFRLLAENTGDMICLHEPHGRCIYVSPSSRDLLGFHPDELAEGDPYALIHPDDAPRVRAEAHGKLLRGAPFVVTCYRIRKKSGEYIWVETLAKSITDEHENIVQLVSTSRDITPREKLVRRLEILRQIDHAILRADSPRDIARATLNQIQAFIPFQRGSVTEFDLAAGSGRPLYDSRANEAEAIIFPLEALPTLERLKAGETIRIDNIEALRAPGAVADVLLAQGIRAYISVPLIVQGELFGSFNLGAEEPGAFTAEHEEIAVEAAVQIAIGLQHAALHEQALRHAAELEGHVQERSEALQQEKARVEIIFNSSSEPIVMVCVDGYIEATNPAFHTWFGFHDADVKRRRLFALFAPECAEIVAAALEAVVQDRHTMQVEVMARRADGSLFHVDLTLDAVGSSDVSSVICNFHDITERIQKEEHLHAALEKERELNELKSRFVALVSHEFRTPLATIQTSSDLIKMYGERLSDRQKTERLNNIQAQVRHLTELLEDVLTIGRSDMGKLEFNPAPFNIRQLCEAIVEQQRLIATPPRPIHFAVKGAVSTITGDRKLLQQAISNLLHNAVKYSPHGEPVSLTLTGAGDHITIRVADDGIGIPDEDRQHLFEVFHRAGNVGEIPGTGLGLIIVKRAVEMHGGSVTVESDAGRGTTFIVTIPHAQP